MIANAVAAVVFIGVLLVAAFLFGMRASQAKAHAHQLSERLGPGEAPQRLFRPREVDAVGHLLGGAGTWLHALILRAGSRATVGQILLASLATGVLPALVLIQLLRGPQGLIALALAALPVLVLSRMATKRSRQITEQLPDALDLISRALRSGHAFGEALRMTAQEIPAPLSEELGPTAEEHRLGIELRTCLDGLLQRLPGNFEIRMFASSVLLHRDTGGNLIEILEQLADTVRERVVFEQKAHAMTAEVRTSAAILEALPFLAALLLSIITPGYLAPLLEPGLGRSMLVGGAISMVIGVVLMRRIARVEA